jgi:organic radical activating enzyme
MTQKIIPIHHKQRLEYRERVLNSKSPSFCGAKWYHVSMWLSSGRTTSCHHNPPHAIDLEAIKTNPKALHNTTIKKQERAMMQRGERPYNCQFCWIMEDLDPNNISDRVWQSTVSSEQDLELAFSQSADNDYDPHYMEISFDQTCQLACSYCCSSISSTWSRDIKRNGPYLDLPTDLRNHYVHDGADAYQYPYGVANPYTEAWFAWWDQSLHKSLKQLRITGGEPMMSGHTWRLLQWLADNPNSSKTRIEITTNLTYETDLVEKMLSYVSRIKQPVWIYTSGESAGSRSEYVRDGHDWNQWVRNLETVRTSGLIETVSVCGTMSAASTDGFVEFLYYLLEEKRRHGPKWMILSVNLVRYPTFQNIVVLPMELRLQYAQEMEKFMQEPDVEHLFLDIEKDHINRYINYMRTMQKPHNDHPIDISALQKDFKSFFTQYDQRRGKDFAKTFPRLADWYNSI